MNKSGIIEEIPKLLPQEDDDEWLDEDDPFTPEQKAMLDERIAEHERNPEAAIPWEEFKRELWGRIR